MILRGPDVHPGVNYIIRGDTFRVRITDRTKYIWAGFRCLNPDCHGGSDEEPYDGYRPDLNTVLPAPNFLPGLELMKQMRRNEFGDLEDVWSVDLDTTICNLRGEDENGRPLEEEDPRAIIHNRWVWEKNNPDEFFPEHLEVYCPHCGSPAVEDEHGNVYRTEVEDLSLIHISEPTRPY